MATKTRDEIEALKRNWKSDPCFDLEEAEGFEEHREELLQFSNETIAERKANQPRWNVELAWFTPSGEPYSFTNVTDLTHLGGSEITFTDNQGATHRTTIPYLISRITKTSK